MIPDMQRSNVQRTVQNTQHSESIIMKIMQHVKQIQRSHRIKTHENKYENDDYENDDWKLWKPRD